jgi:hypothetical protein
MLALQIVDEEKNEQERPSGAVRYDKFGPMGFATYAFSIIDGKRVVGIITKPIEEFEKAA